ncbi:MAG: DUF615 domain-containing protein [Gammaproteobacteria bacterium]|jgi:ribosome-associated protein|nr:DUF615 domain-containing protein [Gammaproteobacteria bacterium]MBQ0775300.1 DUF615 domain-containing protein [Gammaproteobacteria bacterium]|tara:strand:+ start:129360 stop:129890 length:531 start_codon:yes stop_codon:yes gene_type:complete
MEEYNDDEYISKTELKRESDHMRALGEKLMSMKARDLNRLPLSERLRRAIDESQRITAHEARRRHASYVGKLMREDDGDRVEAAITELDNPYRHRWITEWQDKLYALDNSKESSQLLQDLLLRYEHGDRQHLRNLVRNALNARCALDADNNAKDKAKRERKKLADYINTLEKQQKL